MQLRRDISPIEFIIYLVVWTSSVIYSIYCFATTTNKYFYHYEDVYGDFKNNWALLHRKKDEADYEWPLLRFLVTKVFRWNILSTFVTEILRHLQLFKVIPIWQVLVALIFIIVELGFVSIGVLIVQPFLYLSVMATHSKTAIWLLNFITLGLLVWYKNNSDDDFMKILGIEEVALQITVTLYWINLRCLSYSIDCIDSNESLSILKLLSYCFYIPLLVSGPFISYNDFKFCYRTVKSRESRLFKLTIDLLRIMFWYFFTDLCLHFIYVNAIAYQAQWIKQFDLWSLCGYGYTMGQYFQLKYVIQYGLSGAFSKFENIQVPPLPVCIGRVHLYSDMWKYFDVGLYKFLLRYIYIPFMKSFIESRFLSSIVCFLFIYIWHGTSKYILIWTVFNYLAISLEHFSKWVYKLYLHNSKIVLKIGDAWLRRITCLLATPLLIISAMSNFVFLANHEVGLIFLQKISNAPLQSAILLVAIIYTLNQISTEFRSESNIFCKRKKIILAEMNKLK